MNCPQCGEVCERDMVDIGLGEMPTGPFGCENCGWVQPPEQDLFLKDEDIPF